MSPDVVMICDEERTNDKYFQIWTNDKSGGFSLMQLGRLPKGFQSMSFADMDRDGTIDMVFSTCTSVSSSTGIGSGCELHIAYNQQLPLCTSTTQTTEKNGKRTCRRPEELCSVDTDFRFDLGDRRDNQVCSVDSNDFCVSYLTSRCPGVQTFSCQRLVFFRSPSCARHSLLSTCSHSYPPRRRKP